MAKRFALPGLSPRVRGNRYFMLMRRPLRGPIPARAGQPGGVHTASASLGAYPRACGATSRLQMLDQNHWGLSPRVRGNRATNLRRCWAPGPIPARAGQPLPSRWRRRGCWAYPRACGATPWPSPVASMAMGLSPRVRGNHRTHLSMLARWGPIPARAGQPEGVALRLHDIGAYPRACGATRYCNAISASLPGLSPRVRGNPQPIPRLDRAVAYPRACGATAGGHYRSHRPTGLSPRVRGNQAGE